MMKLARDEKGNLYLTPFLVLLLWLLGFGTGFFLCYFWF